jgi:hypothetical protein
MSVLDKLTEGIVNRDLQKEGAALLNKWEKTGLLEGLDNDQKKDGMARLLENQAKELLREASSMASGDVEGFASVAFPIVRRVFGNLIANDLVSVQPMSLPSGLIFFLDFTVNSVKLGYGNDESLYGGGVVAGQLTGGVNLSDANAEKGPYSLNNGYSSPTASATLDLNKALAIFGTASAGDEALDKAIRYDPDLSGSVVFVVAAPGEAALAQADLKNLVAMTASMADATEDALVRQIRRLTEVHSGSTGDLYDGSNTDLDIKFVFEITGSGLDHAMNAVILEALTNVVGEDLSAAFPITDNFTNGMGNPGSVVGTTEWALENTTEIPEIDLKVDSVSVTAQTKKLKAKWTPELGQDLNAYHNLDAEVELTGILSEQIALEIDREILEDLIKGATGGTLYWSRAAGRVRQPRDWCRNWCYYSNT